MLINIVIDEAAIIHLNNYGLTVKDGVLSGELEEFEPTTEEEVGPLSELTQILRAYKYVQDNQIPLSAHMGGLSYDTAVDMMELGYNINMFGILTITDITKDTFDELTYLSSHREINGLREEGDKLIERLIENWPKHTIIRDAMNIATMHNFNDARRMDYYYSATFYHAKLPVPLSQMGHTYLDGYVEVSIKENNNNAPFKYSVFVSDHPVIETDTLPSERDIPRLIKEYGSIWYRIKKFIRELS